MPSYAYAILAAGWLFWLTPFFLAKRSTERPKELDRRARWGILLVVVAYSMLWQSKFWERSLPVWRVALAILFFAARGPSFLDGRTRSRTPVADRCRPQLRP